MSKRRVMSISIGDNQFRDVSKFAHKHKFRSVSALVRACLALIIRFEREPPPPAQKDSEYILEMFGEYEQHIRQPDGTVPCRKHKKSVNDG